MHIDADRSGQPASLGLTAPMNGGGKRVNDAQYEGFEPVVGLDKEFDIAADEETHNDDPIFRLEAVQYTPPSPLLSMDVASNRVTMAFLSGSLRQLNLTDDESKMPDIPLAKKGDWRIHRIFVDPLGRHCLISTAQGENFYLFDGWPKARPLSKIRGLIDSVAWNPLESMRSSSSSTSSREILIGMRSGTLFEAVLDARDDMFKSPDRLFAPVWEFTDGHGVSGIVVELEPKTKRIAVLVSSGGKLFSFRGVPSKKEDQVGGYFNSVFASFKDSTPPFVELPPSTSNSGLFHHPKTSSDGPRISWLNGEGIYHGTIITQADAIDVLEQADLLHFPSRTPLSPIPTNTRDTSPPSSSPIGAASSGFHIMLLFSDRICAIRLKDGKKVWEDNLDLRSREIAVGMASDAREKTYWVFTSSSILEVRVVDEDRDIWKVLRSKGNYAASLDMCKTPEQRAIVCSDLADQHFKAGRFIQAAQYYAQSSRGFEEIALSFQEVQERDALRLFLVVRLERTPKTAVIQRTVIALWLVEIYLSKLNQLDDVIAASSASQDVENLKVECKEVTDEITQFFQTYRSDLHSQTVYELVQSHGRTDIFLAYASSLGDWDRVVSHYVMEEAWTKAIDQLNRQPVVDLYYKYASVLFRQAPKETVDSWKRQSSLDPVLLVPSLSQFHSTSSAPQSVLRSEAIRYLQHATTTLISTASTVHNLLLTLLAATASDKGQTADGLLSYISTSSVDPISNRPYYDLDYALRLCTRQGHQRACIYIYSQMEMWEDCVDLALTMGEVELAKINADKAEDDPQLRKKLWLKIAKYVVKDKNDIKSAMQFLENSSSLLRIEDILPFFPDFVVIDDFKDEICNALESYSMQIEQLKQEMNDASQTADRIRQDIEDLEQRFVSADRNDKCTFCLEPLLSRPFYVFPCQHIFHADCLISQVKEYLPTVTLRKIVQLQDELVKLTDPTSKVATHARARSLAKADVEGNISPALASGGLLSANGLVRTVALPVTASSKALAAAGAGLRDLILPDTLATAITSGINFATWSSSGANVEKISPERLKEKVEKIKSELDHLLAAGCPLCEGVVAGLDRPFVLLGEVDASWEL